MSIRRPKRQEATQKFRLSKAACQVIDRERSFLGGQRRIGSCGSPALSEFYTKLERDITQQTENPRSFHALRTAHPIMKAQDYFYSFWIFILAKLLLILVLANTGTNFFGGGNDSEYYHAYAIGNEDLAVNAWPVLLRALNSVHLYTRDGVSYALKFIGFIFIPLSIAKLSKVRHSPVRNRAYWAAALVVSAYPTVIFYTTDIYREVFMLAVWTAGIFVFKYLSEKQRLPKRVFLLLIGMAFTGSLYALRPYLGAAYLVALIFSSYYDFRLFSVARSLLFVTLIIFFLYILGILEPLLAYRASFAEESAGGSTLGIGFFSAADFFPDLLKTTAFQLFGLYLPNTPSIIVFITESTPFLFFLLYLVANRAYSNKFVDYLIVFSVAYASIWLLGNDNLGTAVRLRIFNYVSILIAFFVVYQNKKQASFLRKQDLQKTLLTRNADKDAQPTT